jgi:hypothetical protein
VRRPTILQLAPRRYRVVDSLLAPVGQDYRGLGLLLIAAAAALFVALDLRFTDDPLLPFAVVLLGAFGVAIIVRAPLRPTRVLLMDLDLSAGLFRTPLQVTNGSGLSHHEYAVTEVDELLFAMRGVPIEGARPQNVSVDGFSLYVRMRDGELVPVVEASFDQDRTFKAAQFLADAFNVGIKQVGKGWRADEPT